MRIQVRDQLIGALSLAVQALDAAPGLRFTWYRIRTAVGSRGHAQTFLVQPARALVRNVVVGGLAIGIGLQMAARHLRLPANG